MTENVDDTLKQILHKICDNYVYHTQALEVMSDYIYIFMDCPQTVAPLDVVRTLKSMSAIELFKTYQQLKRFYTRYGCLWCRGYFLSTVEYLGANIVIQYIEEQKNQA